MKGIKQVDDYIITKELSKEKEIILYEAVNKKSGDIVVIKAFPTSLFKDKRKLEFFKSELKLISGFDHPNIIKFYSLKKTEKFYYLIMEYCNGGKLSDYKAYYEKRNKRPLNEQIIQKILKQILCGLSYMHNCNTIHRNLTLDNIEINFDSISNKVKPNQNPENIDYSKVSLLECTAKISNLSFARELDENGVASTVVGSPIFMAPDIIINALQPQKKEFYNSNADLWTLGAITYDLLVGKPPFDGDDITAISKKLNEGTYSFPLSLNLSIEAMTLIDGLIQYTQDKRIKWEDLVKHAFIKSSIENFHYLDINELKKEGIKNELILNIKQNNDKFIWSKEILNTQVMQANINNKAKEKEKEKQKRNEIEKAKEIEKEKEKNRENEIEKANKIKKEKEGRAQIQALKEIQQKKKALEKEMLNIEKEKLQTEKTLLQAEKDKKEAEELKKKTELEKTRLKNYEKNQKEINEENMKKDLENKTKEESIRKKELDKLTKEKERLDEEKRKTKELKYEAELILKNAEKIKQEAEETNQKILKEKQLEEQKRQIEDQKRQLEEQFKDSSKTKLIQQIQEKENEHSNKIAQLQMNLIVFKALSSELKGEALEKNKMQEILKEKEKEHQKLLLQIDQITNEKEKKLLQIEKETQEKELKEIREKEELERRENELKKDIGATKENLQQMGIQKEELQISLNPPSSTNNENNNTNFFNDEWECYSTKSIEFNNDNADLADYVLVGNYVSSKTNI